MTQIARRLPLAFALALALAGCRATAPTAVPQAPATASAPATAAPNTDVLIVAHRGGAALAPENTLAAFDNAVRIGVDMVECDVHLSKDGEVVVMHDATLGQTTDGSGLISSLTLAELKTLNAAAHFGGGAWPTAEPIPTLGEVLDAVKGKAWVQIEIKVSNFPGRYPGIEQKVIDLVKARGMAGEVILISFDFPTLVEVKKIDPNIKTGALANASWMTMRLKKTPEEIVEEVLQESGADYFMPTASFASEDLVKAVHAKGLKIGVWTANTPAEMERLAGLGVDAITTDKPDELKRVLGR